MKLREGFVSNSSSCSYILKMPDDATVFCDLKRFKEYFGLNLNDEESEILRQVVIKKKNQSQNVLFRTLIAFLNDALSEYEGWYSSYDGEDVLFNEEKGEDTEALRFMFREMQDNWWRLLYLEIGNSCEWSPNCIEDEILMEKMGNIYTAKGIISKNGYVINNH